MLYEYARRWQAFLNHAVIPVTEDKRPMLDSWSQYRETLPVDSQHRAWFGRAESLAVIAGGGLLIVDIDNPELIEPFAAALPDLYNTLRVRTSRGLHLYYFTSEATHTKAAGVDFIYSTYAILPPSPGKRLDSAWIKPRQISSIELIQLQAHFGIGPQNNAKNIQNSEPVLKSVMTSETIRRVYSESLQAQGSRNVALFKTAALAKDSGVDRSQLESALLPLFVPGQGERIASREKEASKTISSAYSRPVRLISKLDNPDNLPLAASEALSRLKLKAVDRGLRTLYSAGFSGGSEITQSLIQAAYTDWGMRRSVTAAINGNRLFKQKVSPRPFQNTTGVDESPTAYPETNGICRSAKPTKNNRGRPEHIYIMPTIAEVCEILDIAHWLYARITPEQLEAVRTYRIACIKALIARNAGVRGRGLRWQASVFGVSVSTIQRWHKLAGIVAVQACIPVIWQNLDHLFEPYRRLDHWLEDQYGKRYPDGRAIAMKLLGKGLQINLHRRYDIDEQGRRRSNYLYYPDRASMVRSLPHVSITKPEPKPEQKPLPIPHIPKPTPAPAPPVEPPHTEQPPAAEIKPLSPGEELQQLFMDFIGAWDSSIPALWNESRLPKKLQGIDTGAAYSSEAITLSQTINDMGRSQYKALSKKAAQIALQTDATAAGKALRRMQALQRSGYAIRNPAGFFMTLFRQNRSGV